MSVDAIPANEGQVHLSANPVPLTAQYAPRTVIVHQVTGAELDTIAALSNSVHLAFFGICFGAVIAFSIVLSTTTITDVFTHVMYAALLWISALLTVYFGIRAFLDLKKSHETLKEVKGERS